MVAGRLAAKSLLTMVVKLMVFSSRFAQHGRDAAFSEASLRVPSRGDRSPIAPNAGRAGGAYGRGQLDSGELASIILVRGGEVPPAAVVCVRPF